MAKRAYLPYGLTKAEKRSPALRKKLSSCIRQVEKASCPKSAKRAGKYDYSRCEVNPVAVCRSALEAKPYGVPKRDGSGRGVRANMGRGGHVPLLVGRGRRRR